MAQAGQLKNTDFDNLVFEQRNKAYGAYELRRKYNDRILISLLIGVAVVGFIVALPYISKFIAGLSPQEEEVSVPIDWSQMAPPPMTEEEEIIPPPPPEDVAPPQEQAASVEFKTLEMTDQPVQQLTTPEDLNAANPGSENNAGTGGDLFTMNSSGDGGQGKIIDEPKKQEVFTSVEVMPEFVGGEPAMRKFIQDHVVYPERAKQMNLEGKVYVRFMVDEFGNISNISVLRGPGQGLDDAAVAVVKKMPRWKPGKQGGRAVKVWFTLPVDFTLQ